MPRSSKAPPPAAQAPQRIPTHWAIALLILAVAAAFRFHDLAGPSLWIDELYSLATSTGHFPDLSPLRPDEPMPWPDFMSLDAARPWWRIWSVMQQGRDATHPPLYILVLRLWRELFGESEFAARSLSAVASLAALLLLFDAGRTLLGPRSAVCAMALMALAVPQIRYGQETRPYAMLLALGLAAMAAMARIERGGASPRRLVALAAAMLAMALTHYFSFGALLALGLYALLRLRGRDRWKTIGAMGAAAVLFLATWGPALWSQRSNTEFDFLNDRGPGQVARTLRRADVLPLRYLGEIDAMPRIPGYSLLLVAAPLALASRRRELLLPILWLACTAGAVVLLDLARGTRHLEHIRYTLLASPGLYLLIAALVRPARVESAARVSATATCDKVEASPLPALPRSTGGGMSGWRIGAGYVIAGGALLYAMARLPVAYEDWRGQDWRGLGALLRAEGPPEQPIVFAAEKGKWLAEGFCMGLAYYAHDSRRPVIVLDGPAPAGIVDYLRRQPRFWLLVEGNAAELVPGAAPLRWQGFPKLGTLFEVRIAPPAATQPERR